MADYTAILFDLDGVVIDTQQEVTEFWLKLAAERQVELSPADFQQHIYGCPVDHTLDFLFAPLPEQDRQAVHATLREYEIAMTYRAMPGVVALLQELRQQNVPTALVTSAVAWKVDTVSAQLGLADLFTTRVLASDIRNGKPHPEGYLLAAERLGQPPGQCIVFEDSVSGVTAAVAAGTLCVGVRPADIAPPLLAAGACCSVPDFSQVSLKTAAGETSGPLTLQVSGEACFPLLVRQK